MAQDPRPPNQPNPPIQSPPSENNSAPGSDTTTGPSAAPPSTAPSPPSLPILPAQTPKSVYFRPTKQPPIIPAYFTVPNISVGYSVTNLAMPSSGRIALTGMDISLAADSGRRIGAKLNFSYTLAPNVSNTGHRADLFSYLIGPTFSLWKGKSLSTYAQVLAGGARVAGPFPNASGGFNTGHVHYPAWDFGGSAEYDLSPAFGFRVTIDCLHTNFFDSLGAVRGQYDIRVVNSIVYYLGQPVRSKHRQ